MSAIKYNQKELVFECESESEAMEILRNYRKKNYHLVSKITSPEESPSSATVLKLVKFCQTSNATDLETVWENFVSQMSSSGLKNSFIAEVLKRIKNKKSFWETHPEDHLRDILMDAKNYAKPEGLAKVLVYVAPEEDLVSFFCSYQKSIASAIDELGIFVLSPDSMKISIKDLKVSSQVQVLSYNAGDSIEAYQADINAKIGLVLVTPELVDLLAKDSLNFNISEKKISLLQAPCLVSEKLFKNSVSYIAGGYDSNSSAFSAMCESLINETKIAFLWNENNVGTILNPEAQILKSLDNLLSDEDAQQFHNK